ncbi:MAG: TIGR03759 family integrating conjugative element protein [Gammaproteobacteria bacterium]
MKKFHLFLLLSILTGSVLAAENDVSNTMTKNTTTQNTISESGITGSAQSWNLTEKEWNQYLTLMKGENGLYYRHLTPPSVLGINAENPEDLKHFAEIHAKQEHAKIEHELRYNIAFHEAAKRLYPDEPVIKPFDLTPYTPVLNQASENNTALKSGDHLVLFIDISKTRHFDLLNKIIGQLSEHHGVILDIYCLNAENDNSIRDWAKLNEVPLALVAESQITLNNEKGKFKKITSTTQLPYLMRVREGISQPVNMDVL